MKEQIVFVNSDGTPNGKTGEKLASHNADTKLHLAFSCYVFNNRGQFLLTQRSMQKKVFPGVWTNSVCGHPMPGENMIDAIKRRLAFELGMTGTDFVAIVPNYTYKTPPFNGVIEHEYCPIHVARAASRPEPNPAEVAAYKWVDWDKFVAEASADTKGKYSWWSKDQLDVVNHHPLIHEYAKPVNGRSGKSAP